MTNKEKSDLFKEAHTIARRTKKDVGDYMIAFKLALKILWLQEKYANFEHKLCEKHVLFTEKSPIRKMSKMGRFFRKSGVAFRNNATFAKVENSIENCFLGIGSSLNEREYITFCIMFNEKKVNVWLGIE